MTTQAYFSGGLSWEGPGHMRCLPFRLPDGLAYARGREAHAADPRP